MAQSKKIYQVTDDFIEAFWILKEQGKMPKHEDLIKIMGINSMSGLSSILKKRHNIQTEQWQKFKAHFKFSYISDLKTAGPKVGNITESQKPANDDQSSERNPQTELTKMLKAQKESIDYLRMTLEAELKGIAKTQQKILEQLNKKPGKPGKK